MSKHSSHSHDHLEHDTQGGSSSPVPEKSIPWVIVALVAGLIFVAFAIPAGTFIAR